MTFLNPLLLIAGLGISLPIIAHLLNRYRVKHTPWAAMQFLNRSVRVRSRQLRLRDLLLLLLRCGAVLLFALAIARPATKSSGGQWIPGERRAGVVIALDASFSMQHSEGESTRFDQAIERIAAIGDQMHAGDPVSLVLLGGEHSVVLRNMAFAPDRFAAALEQLKVSDETLQFSGVPKRLQELVDDMDAHQKEVYILTDAQSESWSGNAQPLRRSIRRLGESASVFLVPLTGGSENLAVTDLSLVSGELRKGSEARYQATVRNFGDNPVADVQVRCRADGAQIDSKQIPLIQPGASETVSLFVPFYNAGATQITAEIEGDALPADNIRRVVANVRDRVSVLCVDGSSGEAGPLVMSALLARGKSTNSEDYLVRSIPWLALPAEDLGKVDVIIVANVPQITAAQSERLSQFVRQGNGLVWFAGDQVKSASWNGEEGDSEVTAPLLPGVLAQVVDCSDALGAGKPLDPSMPDHALSRPLQSLPEDLLSETRFLKRIDVEPAPTSFTVLNLAGSNSPLLLEHTLGRGQVVMFATSAEATWNNMALTPVFPMLMQQIVTYLAGREFEQPQVVGDSLSLSYTEAPDASDAVFDTPSDETITVPVRAYRNQYIAMLENAGEAGFYTARVSVQAPGMPIAVNVDTRESNVASLSTDELAQRLADTEITIANSEAELLSAIDTARTGRSLWRYAMMAGLVLLVAECLLADRQLRRQWSRPQHMDMPAAGKEAMASA